MHLFSSSSSHTPKNLDIPALQGISSSAYAYDYDNEGTNVLDAANLNLGFESIVIPFAKMTGCGEKQRTPKFSKFQYTYDWVYKHSIQSDYKVWFMIDGNFHLCNKEGISFGNNTQEEVNIWVEALVKLLVDEPWGTHNWPDGKSTPPVEMPGLLGFHFDIEPHKKDTVQYDGYCLFLQTLRGQLDVRGFSDLQMSIYAHSNLVTDPKDTRIFQALNHPSFLIGLVGADLGPQSHEAISPSKYGSRLADILKKFVSVASASNYKGRIGCILPAAGQESEFSHLTKKDCTDLHKNFQWTMQDYTKIALLNMQMYSPQKKKNAEKSGQIPITEALFWRLAPWPLSEDGYGKRPACLTHSERGDNVADLLASVWPRKR